MKWQPLHNSSEVIHAVDFGLITHRLEGVVAIFLVDWQVQVALNDCTALFEDPQ